MVIRNIAHLLAMLQAGKEKSTVIVRPPGTPAAGVNGQNGKGHIFTAELTITPGEPPRCDVFSEQGERVMSGPEALAFLASVGRLACHLVPSNGLQTSPRALTGPLESFPAGAPPEAHAHPGAQPRQATPANGTPVPRRTDWGQRWVETKPMALPRDHRKLLLAMDGRRTAAQLADMLWPHLEEKSLAQVLSLLDELRQAGFISYSGYWW